MKLIELGDGSSSAPILTQILWYNNFHFFYSYFDNLELLNVTFIFVIALSVSSMDRYEKVTLKKNNNRCGRVKISVLTMYGGISSGKG
jgi:hypothetical protein